MISPGEFHDDFHNGAVADFTLSKNVHCVLQKVWAGKSVIESPGGLVVSMVSPLNFSWWITVCCCRGQI